MSALRRRGDRVAAGAAVVDRDAQLRREALGLPQPVADDRGGRDDERRPRVVVGDEREQHRGLPEAHVVGEDPAEPVALEPDQPVEPVALVVAQRDLDHRRARRCARPARAATCPRARGRASCRDRGRPRARCRRPRRCRPRPRAPRPRRSIPSRRTNSAMRARSPSARNVNRPPSETRSCCDVHERVELGRGERRCRRPGPRR